MYQNIFHLNNKELNNNNMRLKNKVAIVSGGSRDIGRAVFFAIGKGRCKSGS
jgi:hypothetical protein